MAWIGQALAIAAAASGLGVLGLAASVAAPPSPADVAALCITPPAGGGPAASVAEWAQGAQLFAGLGDFHRPVGTASKDAQAYFDQGMRFLWAFNHDEATRSFAAATRADPQCALCYWGVSLTVGPNYNLPVTPAPRAQVAWAALQEAQAHAASAAPAEQALITALAARYPGPEPLDPAGRRPALVAYAQAMKEVADRFPEDDDIAILAAEAMMTVNAWALWTLDGQPAPGTEEIVARLEHVLARSPRHPGANHYYIHAVEASPAPARAVPAAERLGGLLPAAGHLEHMPAHIMQRVGRYEAAAEANRRGIAADLAYYRLVRPPDYYVMYTAHNYQFLAYSAAMEGRKAEALDAAAKARALLPDEMLMEIPGADWHIADRYAVMLRFGLWDEIIAEPEPNRDLAALSGAYLAARAVAFAANGAPDEARRALARLEARAAMIGPQAPAGFNHAADVLAIGMRVARARIAAAEGRRDEAVAELRDAVGREDRLSYDEPADWFFPVRHVLGAALLNFGRAAEAEAVYREDLRRNPENGWALFGLAQALEAQSRAADAAAARQRFKAAWQKADVELAASAF
jgi:tetratricopeptide (TPR) repeat protein